MPPTLDWSDLRHARIGGGMLVVTRRLQESVMIGTDITVHREEIFELIRSEQRPARST